MTAFSKLGKMISRGRFTLYSVFLLFWSLLSVQGQTSITGEVVSDKMEPISGASVSLLSSSGSILAFAITKNDGSFEITIDSAESRFTLRAKALDFTELSEEIRNETQDLQLMLFSEIIDLKEVVIREKPMRQRGDTLNYAVSAFKEEGDRVLTDLLEKLPGIEVNPRGQILYQGEPINKFYIENMDLLGSRYSLAHKNLPVDAVTTVQVLENHQPIKMFEDLIPSGKAAINIKLKKNITATGTAELGSGFSPLLWKAKVTPMVFQKKNQMIASYQSNNTGDDVTQQVKALTIEELLGGNRKNYEWVNIPEILFPGIPESRWLDNQTHLGTLNFLKKLSDDSELRLNVDYFNEYRKQSSDLHTTYFLPEDTVTVIEQNRNTFLTNHLQGKLNYTRNSTINYLYNELEFRGEWLNEHGRLDDSHEWIDQKTKKPNLFIQNKFAAVTSVGEQLIDIISDVSYQHKKSDLSIVPGVFSGFLNDSTALYGNYQHLEFDRFHTDNRVSLVKKLSVFTFKPELGASFIVQNMDSELQNQEGPDSFSFPGDNFQNDLSWNEGEVYFNPSLQLSKGRWYGTLDLSTAWRDYRIRDKQLSDKIAEQKFLFLPSFWLQYKAGPFVKMDFRSGYSESFDEISQLYFGYILRNYRQLQRTITDRLPLTKNWRTSIGLEYKNPMKSLTGNIRYGMNRSKKNMISSQEMNELGYSVLTMEAQTNRREMHVLNASISKYITPVKGSLRIRGGWQYTKAEHILNGQLSPMRYSVLSYGIKFSTQPLRWLSMQYNGDFSFMKLELTENRTQNQKNNIQKFKLKLYPVKRHQIHLSGDLYYNDLTETQRHTFFVDLMYRYTLPKVKIDFEAGWYNIFNKKYFSQTSLSDYYVTEERIRLRPGQFFASVKFSF